ncbi:MAG: HigA family addiction module antitoxin [Eggerthellaceae bacterium]|nr:HigA family addiction module antitoxin [Eggerthellaceae bacterium]
MIKNPIHPGELLADELLEARGLTITEAAQALAMSRVALSRVLNGKAGISPVLAIRLEYVGIGTAQVWYGMQADYDLAQAQAKPILAQVHRAALA